MLKMAARVQNLRTSAVFEITATAQMLKRKGYDVISLAAGEPDFNTPEPIQKACTEAMANGITKYSPAAGFLALREALAEKISRDEQYPVSPEEVIITYGAKHAIYLALQCLIEAGQCVLLPTPAWVSYGPMIELTGAGIFPLPLYEEDGFRPNLDRWKGMVIPSNAVGIILNSPNNPSGAVFSKEDLIRVVGWAMQRNLWILSDEVYGRIVYPGSQHTSVASLGPEVRDSLVLVDSVSKTYAMTGWRLGWAITSKELVKKMTSLQSQSTSNVTSFVQMAAISALQLPGSFLQDMMAVFERRRRYCMQRLDALSDYLTYTVPEGAFYFFINLSKFLNGKKSSDVEFCRDLLLEHHVGLVPGTAFGKERFIRLSYATSDENLKKAFDRIETYLKQAK